ncbi:hypothetical protein M0R45_035193 [Rubus argutus]|uniref:Uncharacterized protein n=1 Tax=Rubus argutus TaxID=59490 RepID=A0AAW1VWR4_RUBAR
MGDIISCSIQDCKYYVHEVSLAIKSMVALQLHLVHRLCGCYTHLRITYHGQLRLQDYADFLSLIPSTCLFAISIQGKTGLTFTIPNGITEPLLNGKGDQHSEGRQHSPYGKALFFNSSRSLGSTPCLPLVSRNP